MNTHFTKFKQISLSSDCDADDEFAKTTWSLTYSKNSLSSSVVKMSSRSESVLDIRSSMNDIYYIMGGGGLVQITANL